MSAEARGQEWIGRAASKLTPAAGALSLPVLLLSAVALSAVALTAVPAAADEPKASHASSGTAYILNLGHLQPGTSADGTPGFETLSGFSAVSSPTGVLVPDASAYFDLEGGRDQVTYLTPRFQGLQVTWTGDRNTDSADPGSSKASGSRSYLPRPTSVGASFAQQAEDFELSLGGDYGRTPKAVPGAIRLVDDEKLLRLGAHARIREFTLGGAFGSDIDPGDVGETLSWDAFGRYDFGSLAVGFVYNLTADGEDLSADGNGIPGTLQGGVSYFFTPRMVFTTNLAYGNALDEDGADDGGIAGVLGFSLDF